MTRRDSQIGALVLGSWLNLVLFTMEVVMTIRYFTSSECQRDRWLVKCAVSFNVVLDAVTAVSDCASTYIVAVTWWGRVGPTIRTHFWPVFISVLTTGLVSVVVQIFMIYRYWRMCLAQHAANGRDRTAFAIQIRYLVVVTILLLISFMSLAGYLGLSYMTRRDNYFTTQIYHDFVILALVGGAAGDIGITAVLVWGVSRIKITSSSTKALLRRIAVQSVKTGALTSCVAITASAVYLTHPRSNVTLPIISALGRAYTITMLFTLNNRSTIRDNVPLNSFNNTSALGHMHTSTSHIHTELRFATNPADHEARIHPPEVIHMKGPRRHESSSTLSTMSFRYNPD